MSEPRAPDAGGTGRGRWAEDVAAHWLEFLGFELLDRNRRAADGEIDLVARDGPTLVFVEVRLRRAGGLQGPGDSIDRRKWGRIRRCSTALARDPAFRWAGRRLRIDAILLEHSREGLRLRHLRHLVAPAG